MFNKADLCFQLCVCEKSHSMKLVLLDQAPSYVMHWAKLNKPGVRMLWTQPWRTLSWPINRLYNKADIKEGVGRDSSDECSIIVE